MQCLGGSPGHCTSQHRLAPALHMVSFENFVKSLPPSLSELKVKPIFCFPIKIRDDPTASSIYLYLFFFQVPTKGLRIGCLWHKAYKTTSCVEEETQIICPRLKPIENHWQMELNLFWSSY